LSCKVSLLYTSWMAEMNRELPQNVVAKPVSLSIYDRNTSNGAKGLWE